MWDGIRSGFDTKQPCVFAHTVGEFTFGIILGVLTGGEALVSTAVGKAIKSSVVVLDRLDVVSQVVSKMGCALKITYKAGKPVFNVVYEGVKVLPKFFEAPVSGKLYSFIIPLPQVNLKGGIEAFKEAIAKGEVKVERVLDEADNIIVDEEGNILNKAITKEGEEVELLEKMISSEGNKTNILSKLTGLDDAKAFINSLDEVADANLLYKLAYLSEIQLKGLDDFYKARQSPAGFSKTDYNFTATKTIDGQRVSMTYRRGFPEFHSTDFCPIMNYANGTSGKFKFQSNDLDLNNYSSHFDMANNSLFEKMGLTKNSPKNAGFYESGNYRWDGSSSQFELRNTNGVWEKYTWHHFEDGKTMIPVLSKAHTGNIGGFVHSGGNSIFKNNIKGIFEFTEF